MVCLSVILLCYRMTCLWFCNKRFCNKRGCYLCWMLYSLTFHSLLQLITNLILINIAIFSSLFICTIIVISIYVINSSLFIFFPIHLYYTCHIYICHKFNNTELLLFLLEQSLLNLLGWHWLIKLYRFQVDNSTIHHVYIVLCVHHPKSSLLPSPFNLPLPLLPPPTALSSDNHHTVVCVHL